MIWCKAERRLGVELAKVPKAKGASGPGRGKAGTKAGPAFTDAPTLAEMGVDKKHAARAAKLATIPEPVFVETVKARHSMSYHSPNVCGAR